MPQLSAVPNARPGTTGIRCPSVTSNGSLPSNVLIYGANGSGSTNLAACINLTITQAAAARKELG